MTLKLIKMLVHSNPNIQEFLDKHRLLFQGIVKLESDENISLIAQYTRKIPHSMKSKVNEKLKEMCERDIIEKAEGDTSW